MPKDLKEYFKKRAIKAISKKKVPTPSEKNSVNLRKKLNRGVNHGDGTKTIQSDCRDCPAPICPYDHDLNVCPERSHVGTCAYCGAKVRYRYTNSDDPWKYCPVCIVRFRA